MYKRQPLRDALEAAGLEIDQGGVTQKPGTTVELSGNEAQKVMNFIEAIEDHDDVQKLHGNHAIDEASLS